MKPDDIVPYARIVAEEGVQLQKGMNYASGSRPSIFLMSIRKGSPYTKEQIKRRTFWINLVFYGSYLGIWVIFIHWLRNGGRPPP